MSQGGRSREQALAGGGGGGCPKVGGGGVGWVNALPRSLPHGMRQENAEGNGRPLSHQSQVQRVGEALVRVSGGDKSHVEFERGHIVTSRAPALRGELTLSHTRGSAAGGGQGMDTGERRAGDGRANAGLMDCAERRAHSRHWQDTALAEEFVGREEEEERPPRGRECTRAL